VNYELMCKDMNGKTAGLGKSFDTGKLDVGLDYTEGEMLYPPLHLNCYDKDTEIYTKEEWKLFKDVIRGEEVLTLNPDSFEKEYSCVKNCVNYKYNNDMIHFSSQWVDLLVTPDHKIAYWKWGKIKNNIIANIFNEDKILLIGMEGKFCQEFKKSRVHYNDLVYDVEVEKNHIILTRRNGKVVWGSGCRCTTIPLLLE